MIWLSVADARRVHPDQTAQVRACDAATGEHADISGKVTVIGKVADPQTGNLPVRILVENADRRLTLGEAVSATVVVRQDTSLAVPVEAVHDLGEGPVISVVRGGKTAVLQDAKLGLKDDHWVEVNGTDLKPGEDVVIEGGYGLPAGTEVGTEKAANP